MLIILTLIIYNYLTGYKKVMSFKESLDLTELIIITAYQNNKKLNFLLDSGATDSAINIRELKNLKYEEMKEVNVFFGIDGEQSYSKMVNLQFTINDKSYDTIFQVVDMSQALDLIKQESGVTIHGILGNKFFKKYKYILDYNKLAVYKK
jgi:hypothetical protein